MSPLAALDIDRLTVEQKLDLIGQLWDSIPEADLPPLTEAQMRELERRIADADANPHLGRPWEEVKAPALGRKMTLPLIVRPDAEADMGTARTWYERQ